MVYLFMRSYLHYVNREVQERRQSSDSNISFCLNIQMLKTDITCGNSNSKSKKSTQKKATITENSGEILKGN